MKKVLLFGFKPFLNYPENPTELLIKNLPEIEKASIEGKILPVEYERIENNVINEINNTKPDLVIGMGLAPGRSKISIERIAINYILSDSPDNNGKLKKFEMIDKNFREGIFSTINIEKLLEILTKNNIPAEISLSAGGYICNEAMFYIMRETEKLKIKGGFIHFPCHLELATKYNLKCPTMDIKMMNRALKLIIENEIK
ncbi:MAG: pyroglutamyl-peptidase I [Thermoplasmata archaeon]|nr:pyrrolidone-carboxylate peptidase [Thermoplasmata archaeon]